MSLNVVIEICAGSVESAIAAKKGGAHRIELCALSEGGLTPSQAMIEYVKRNLKIEAYVLIRPRTGDFSYSRAEFEVMKSDIFSAKAKGADGIVTGMLNTDGTIDTCRMKEIMDLARPLPVTFHRAFDLTRDPDKALEEIIKLGCKRILTSGQARDALIGADLIARLVKIAEKRISFMPGGGINAGNLRQIFDITGAMEYHLSATTQVASRMIFKKEGISMGNATVNEYEMIQTDQKMVAEICQIASILGEI